MNLLKMKTSLLLKVTLLMIYCSQIQDAWSWGERGHYTITSIAARMLKTKTKDPIAQEFSRLMQERSVNLGHLASIPDTSWRLVSVRPRVSALNSANHYFGPERIVGIPDSDFTEFRKKVLSLPLPYSEITKKFDSTETALSGVPAGFRKLRFYEDVGVAPWRAEQLFEMLVESLRCAKKKESSLKKENLPLFATTENPFLIPENEGASNADLPLPTYRCSDHLPRRSDLYAAIVISGIFSHFIGDQGQPYHPTADDDGWATGNGGIHTYFEIDVVDALDEQFAGKIEKKVKDPRFVKEKAALFTKLSDKNGMVDLMLRLGLDSIEKKNEVARIDDRVAILGKQGKSKVLAYGDHPRHHKDKSDPLLPLEPAKRRPATDPAIAQAFESIIVERMATSVLVLIETWYFAWEKAGKPNLVGVDSASLPYAHEPPFIWPDFDSMAIKRSWEKIMNQPKTSAKSLEFPKHWWTPIPKEGAPWWEVLPQDARPGEVILSKRNELGILSNFASTPITVRGKKYASLEGFWQMMKFPENLNDKTDPRVSPKVAWPFTREQVAAMDGFEARAAGDIATKHLKELGVEWISFEGKRLHYKGKDQDEHLAIIEEAMRAKVAQNPKVEEVLKSTGSLLLKPDHQQESDAPKAAKYHEIYMKIRSEIQS